MDNFEKAERTGGAQRKMKQDSLRSGKCAANTIARLHLLS